MTLTLPHVDIAPRDSEKQRAWSQWWTPETLASRFAHFALDGLASGHIVEPSAGAGSLVHACLEARPCMSITAVEIDPVWAAVLRRDFAGKPVQVIEGSYLQTDLPRCHVVVMNPPYEGGQDGVFIARAMLHGQRVAALIRVNGLVGLDRHRRVWSRIGSGWQLTGLAYCVRRPQFLAAGLTVGNAESDFCAVRLERGRRAQRTEVEWWT